jgi:acetate kinase
MSVHERSPLQRAVPGSAGRSVLALNAGSSSIKFAWFDTVPSLERALAGRVERIGLPGATLTVADARSRDNSTRPVAAPDHAAGVELLMKWLAARGEHATLAGVGHRVVHGGPRYVEAQAIDANMIAELSRVSAFDPQHLPEELLLIEAVQARFPALVQVACFDTTFHRELPRVAQLLPIPRRYADQGVRRYGFHGLSYAFLMEELAHVAGARAARGRIVLAHLGNGTSLAAVREGKPLDTSMGFTPTAGVPMSTRSGDLDPGLVRYLASTEGMDANRFAAMVNFESGLLGISETSSDMRDLLAREADDARAAEAIALYCYRIRQCIGAYAAALGGIDTLVFAGGIGENAPEVRARICDGLQFMGIGLVQERNAQNAPLVCEDAARVAVRVIRTDEERMIAKTVCRMLGMPTNEERSA